ncbi:MAG TPA: translocase [Actinobacteria bacterium]|nr:translocase [Actinomycetota bacterium]
MFDIGFGEIAALAVIALVVFGPDRLPKALAETARTLRQLRSMAASARQEVAEVMDPVLDGVSVRDLDPRAVARELVDGPASPPPVSREVPAPARVLPVGAPAPWNPDTT